MSDFGCATRYHTRQLEMLNWALIPCEKLILCCVEYLSRISKCGTMFMLQWFVYLIYGYSFIMSMIPSVEYRLRPWLLSCLWLWTNLEEVCGQTGLQNAYQKGIDGTFSPRRRLRDIFQTGSRHHMPRSVPWSGRSGPTDGLKWAGPPLLDRAYWEGRGVAALKIWSICLTDPITLRVYSNFSQCTCFSG